MISNSMEASCVLSGDIPPGFPPFRHWVKHIAAVPKGYLRYQVLELLSERPLSGSEIMSEIERRTNGCWRPSPGSVYPLLSWLQDNGYIEEVPSREAGVRRYTLTERGRALLEEQRRAKLLWEKKFFAMPPLLGALWLQLPPEKAGELRESLRRLARAFIRIGLRLEESFSEEVFEEVLRIMGDAARRLEDLERRMQG